MNLTINPTDIEVGDLLISPWRWEDHWHRTTVTAVRRSESGTVQLDTIDGPVSFLPVGDIRVER